MAIARIVVSRDEGTAKTVAALLKKNAGGGFTSVDGPYKASELQLETTGFIHDSVHTFTDNIDSELWFVIGRF